MNKLWIPENHNDTTIGLKSSSDKVRIDLSRLSENRNFLLYLLGQIQRKEEVKNSIISDDWHNDPESIKRLWIFLLEFPCFTEVGSIDYLKESFAELNPNELWQLHIPPQRITSKGQILRSFDRLAQYLTELNKSWNKIPKYLFGISSLAHKSERFWFTVIDLPQEIQEKTWSFRLMSNRHAIHPKKSHKIQLCYIPTESFLRHYWIPKIVPSQTVDWVIWNSRKATNILLWELFSQ